MTVLLIIHTIIVLLLVGVILMQRSSQDGFTGGGGGAGNMDSFMSGRASANLLTRTTAILATLFMVNSLILAYLAAHTDRGESITDVIAGELGAELDAQDAVKAPLVAPTVPDAE